MVIPQNVQDAPYEVRYCAFVDILGFRQLVQQLRSGTTPVARLRALLREVHKPFTPYQAHEADFRAQSISDAVALSTNPTDHGLSHLFHVLSELSESLLIDGYFIRGAIVKGRLYHDDSMVFGEALVEAHRYESEVVRFPRVMIASGVVQDALTMDTQFGFRQLIRQAEDGPFFLHVLRGMEVETRTERALNSDLDPDNDPSLALYAAIGRMLQRRFEESVDNPRHFEKVQWFARYWNETLPQGGDKLERVRGPGLDPRPAVWG